MTARVDADAVKALITTDLDDDTLDTFIDTAHTVVDANLLGQGLTDPILTKIELYLAAHFVALSEEKGGIVRDSYGSSSVSLANVYSAGYNSTRFGQVAIAIDSTGILAAMGTSKLKAQLRLIPDASHTLSSDADTDD